MHAMLDKQKDVEVLPDEIEEISESGPPQLSGAQSPGDAGSENPDLQNVTLGHIRPKERGHNSSEIRRKQKLVGKSGGSRSNAIQPSLSAVTELTQYSRGGGGVKSGQLQVLEVKENRAGEYFMSQGEGKRSASQTDRFKKRKLLVKPTNRSSTQRNAGILERFEDDYNLVCGHILEELEKLKSTGCDDSALLETFLKEYSGESPIIKLLFVEGRLSLTRSREIYRLVEKRYGITYNITPLKHGTIYEGKSKAEYFQSWTNLSKEDLARQKETQLRSELTQFKAEERLALPKLLLRLKKLCFAD